jgi:hypothetical protein
LNVKYATSIFEGDEGIHLRKEDQFEGEEEGKQLLHGNNYEFASLKYWFVNI